MKVWVVRATIVDPGDGDKHLASKTIKRLATLGLTVASLRVESIVMTNVTRESVDKR